MVNRLLSLEAFHSNGGQEIDLPGFGRGGEATISKDGMDSDPVCMEIQSTQEAIEFNSGPNYHLESLWVDSAVELVELKGITKEHVEHKKENAHPISSGTLELLRSYMTGCK
ncbi:hypothetical protein AAC387_Pa10g1868 [Persea americana]